MSSKPVLVLTYICLVTCGFLRDPLHKQADLFEVLAGNLSQVAVKDHAALSKG